MRLFHFLSEKYGLLALKDQRIKVSRLDNLNDPFELLSVNMEDPILRELFFVKKRISKELGLLCFCESWKSPLLWSHYADRHRGVALEFEVKDNTAEKVRYQKSRTKITLEKLSNSPEDDFEIKLLTTKYVEWKYEQEYRLFFDKRQIYKEGDFFFVDFNPELRLTGIIAGPLCKIQESEIKRYLPKGKSIRFAKSRLAFKTFQVVENKFFKLRP
ncbi:MAG: DUF2971 domain-containing protein [Saprospirales bacterium]|nr:DUF2971 domain-containing protein [Saprospirales bacterium]